MRRIFEVYTFQRGPEGAVVPGPVVQGSTEEEAKQTAASIDPPIAGAVGFQIIREDDGSVRTLTIFGYLGEVPEGYAATLFDMLTEAP